MVTQNRGVGQGTYDGERELSNHVSDSQEDTPTQLLKPTHFASATLIPQLTSSFPLRHFLMFSRKQFLPVSFFKRLYLKKSGNKTMGTKVNLIVAAAAGACTVIVTQPLDTASSRMQTSEFGKSKGLSSSRMQTSEFGKSKGLWKTLTEGTWIEAFDGLGISLLLTSNPSIQYTVFDQLKQKLLIGQLSKETGTESSPEALSAFSAFALGAVSKCIASCLTYPAIRCKVMIQAADDDEEGSNEVQEKSHKTKKTVSDAFYAIWRREGPLGFFKGLQAQILKTVLSSALILMIKEKITRTTWVLLIALKRFLFLKQSRLKNA
ncbi:hypothetical protein ACLB2K_041951 [Fragaria x ananassa]